MSEKSIDATIISDESLKKVRRPDCSVFVRLSVIRTEMNLLDSLRWIQKDSGGSSSHRVIMFRIIDSCQLFSNFIIIRPLHEHTAITTRYRS